MRQTYHFNRIPFVYLLGVLIAGILFETFFPVMNVVWVFGLFVSLILIGFIFLFLFKKKQLNRTTDILLFVGIFIGGILLTRQEDVAQKPLWIGNFIEEAEYLSGEILLPPEQKSKTIKLTVDLHRYQKNGKWMPVDGKILVYVLKPDLLKTINPGDKIAFPNRLSEIKNRGNPFEFDYAAYLKRKGFSFQTFINAPDIFVYEDSVKKSHYLFSLRSHLLQSLEDNIQDTATIALAQATLLNERTLLNDDIYRAYSITGIAHIIAISGLHVSLFFSIILVLLMWIKAPGLRWIKYLMGLPIIWLYVAITNFPPSAVRAAVMFSILFISLAFRRQQNPMNFLAATGFLLLAFRPSWLFDTGVQLSFSAVASIFLFARPVQGLWKPKNRVLKYFWEGIAITIAVQILVFPLVLYYFHQFPLWVFLANIPAASFSLFLMVMGLLLFVLNSLSIPVLWLGSLMSLMTEYFHKIIFFFAERTPDSLRQIYISDIGFWLLTLAVIAIALFVFYKKHLFAIAAFLLLSGFFSLNFYNRLQTFSQNKVIVYNTNAYSLIDYFEGNQAFSPNIHQKTYRAADLQYVLLPSRLGYGVKNIDAEPVFVSPAKEINGNRILFLDKNANNFKDYKFEVDYLILNKSHFIQPKIIKNVFNPDKVILDGSFDYRTAQSLKRQFDTLKIDVHIVTQDGAWIFPED